MQKRGIVVRFAVRVELSCTGPPIPSHPISFDRKTSPSPPTPFPREHALCSRYWHAKVTLRVVRDVHALALYLIVPPSNPTAASHLAGARDPWLLEVGRNSA
jgi:hypothetical protein